MRGGAVKEEREFGIKYSPPQTVHLLPPILMLNTQISVEQFFSSVKRFIHTWSSLSFLGELNEYNHLII